MDSINLKGVGFHLGPKNLRGSRGAAKTKKCRGANAKICAPERVAMKKHA